MVDLTITNWTSGGSNTGGSNFVAREFVIVQNVTDNSSFGVKLDCTNYHLW